VPRPRTAASKRSVQGAGWPPAVAAQNSMISPHLMRAAARGLHAPRPVAKRPPVRTTPLNAYMIVFITCERGRSHADSNRSAVRAGMRTRVHACMPQQPDMLLLVQRASAFTWHRPSSTSAAQFAVGPFLLPPAVAR
jgi:hypothetical protein